MFVKNKTIESIPVDKGVKRKILAHSDKLMTVEVSFEKGAVGTCHTHPHEQLSYILDGSFEVRIEGEKSILVKGDTFYVASGKEHGVVALEDAKILDTFTPQREDFLKPIDRKAAIRITEKMDSNAQLCYFTSSSLFEDDHTLIFISDQTGHPNIFYKDLISGAEKQLTNNTEGILKSYVYFNGNEYRGLGKASISVDARNSKIYFIQGMELCSVDLFGNIKVLNRLPQNQVTAFTHVSADGKKICVPTTDARALETETYVNDSPGYVLAQEGKNEVIKDKPDYDIDERVRTENLSSYLRVFDTETGKELHCERVERAWITHVQFSPINSDLILYNHEWPSDCGIRRMWIWDGENHIRLRTDNGERSKEDWTCHEMWQADGKYIIYHGKYKDGTAYIGRVSLKRRDNIEISLPAEYHRYGHFTASNQHNEWLITDGYYHPEGETENENWGGEWISLLKADWGNKKIEWVPLCRHYSIWDCQDSHPHPIFNHHDNAVYFTSNKDGNRAVYRIEVPTK